MPLHLQYVGQSSVPVEVEGFSPSWAVDKSLAEIERFEILQGNRKLPLAEMFRVSGEAGDQEWHITGDLSGVHWLGAQMTSGRIHLHGSIGRHVGSGMSGGEIHVEGNAGDWLGAEMRGGLIHVHGNAANMLGAAYRGAARGMTGGTILIDGNAGDEIGLAMRRGLIAVRGGVGDLLGCSMIAGTILVFGTCGIRPGVGMRRGTIGILGPHTPRLLPTFRYATTFCSPVMPVMLKHLRSQGLQFDDALLQAEFDYYQGDLVTVGRGEIVMNAKR